MSEISPDTRERDVEGERRVQFLYHTPEVLKKQQHEEEVASSSPSSPPTGLVVTSDLTGEEVAEQERARAEAAGEVIRIDNTPSPGTRDDDDGIGPSLLKTAEAVAAGGRRRRFQNRSLVTAMSGLTPRQRPPTPAECKKLFPSYTYGVKGRFVWRDGFGNYVKTYLLYDVAGALVDIGCKQNCHIQLKRKFVSRRHATLTVQSDGSVLLENLSVANPVLLNRVGVSEGGAELCHGDQLKFTQGMNEPLVLRYEVVHRCLSKSPNKSIRPTLLPPLSPPARLLSARLGVPNQKKNLLDRTSSMESRRIKKNV